MRKIFLLSLSTFILFSCSKKENADTKSVDQKNTQDKEKTETGQNSGSQKTDSISSDKKTGDKKTGKLELKWNFVPAGTGQYDTPITDLNIIVNGKKHFIVKDYYSFSETPKSEFKSYEVPGNALASCRGWWAGAGVDYWVTQKDNELIVTGRDIGETTNDNGEPGDFVGKPRKITTIKLDN